MALSHDSPTLASSLSLSRFDSLSEERKQKIVLRDKRVKVNAPVFNREKLLTTTTSVFCRVRRHQMVPRARVTRQGGLVRGHRRRMGRRLPPARNVDWGAAVSR